MRCVISKNCQPKNGLSRAIFERSGNRPRCGAPWSSWRAADCLNFQPVIEGERKAWNQRLRKEELLAGVAQCLGVWIDEKTRTKKREWGWSIEHAGKESVHDQRVGGRLDPGELGLLDTCFVALVSLTVHKGMCLGLQWILSFFTQSHGRCKKFHHTFSPPLGWDAASFLPITEGSHSSSDDVYLCGEAHLWALG